MQIRDVMSGECTVVHAGETIQKAARAMSDAAVGFLPVQQDGRLIGILTDRDMVTRVLAYPDGPSSTVRDVMSKNVKVCFDDEEIIDVLRRMATLQLRRLPVVDRQERMVGVVSLSDAARFVSAATAGAVFCSITAPNDAERAADLGEQMRDAEIAKAVA